MYIYQHNRDDVINHYQRFPENFIILIIPSYPFCIISPDSVFFPDVIGTQGWWGVCNMRRERVEGGRGQVIKNLVDTE